MHEIILKLKEVKEEKHLSLQKIYDLLEQNGEHLAMTTLHRVFAEGSEDSSFNYDNTIRPLVHLLLHSETSGEAASAAEADALKEIIHMKNNMIEDLQRRLEADHKDARQRIDFLKQRLARMDAVIDALLGRTNTSGVDSISETGD